MTVGCEAGSVIPRRLVSLENRVFGREGLLGGDWYDGVSDTASGILEQPTRYATFSPEFIEQERPRRSIDHFVTEMFYKKDE